MNTKSDMNSPNCLNISHYIKRGQYIDNLSIWMELFPKKQFLVLQSEELFANPEVTMKQVFHFLGVEPYQLQEYPKQNQGSYPAVSKSIYKTLSDYFRPYNQQLEEYLDRKFNWDVE